MIPFMNRNILNAKMTKNKNGHELPSTLNMDAQLPTKPTNPEIINHDVFTELPASVTGLL
jgi:hypothetical protein